MTNAWKAALSLDVTVGDVNNFHIECGKVACQCFRLTQCINDSHLPLLYLEKVQLSMYVLWWWILPKKIVDIIPNILHNLISWVWNFGHCLHYRRITSRVSDRIRCRGDIRKSSCGEGDIGRLCSSAVRAVDRQLKDLGSNPSAVESVFFSTERFQIL